jgi:carboxylate-amine ligase
VLVCDRLRRLAPSLLAISANSPFLDGRDSGLHSARSQIFTKSFPRCGIPDEFGSWAHFADYIDLLVRTNSIVEYTQVWWSIRPHFAFGTVEFRLCDAQSTALESEALASLIVACVAQAAQDIDDGVPARPAPRREIEENFWRAIRHGLDGKLVDLDRRAEYPAAEAPERLLAWTAPARADLGIEVALPALNGAQRQRRMLDTGAGIAEAYAASVDETRETYSGLGTPAEVRR